MKGFHSVSARCFVSQGEFVFQTSTSQLHCMECGVVCSLLWLSLKNANILQDPECVIRSAEFTDSPGLWGAERNDETVNELNLYKTFKNVWTLSSWNRKQPEGRQLRLLDRWQHYICCCRGGSGFRGCFLVTVVYLMKTAENDNELESVFNYWVNFFNSLN